MSDIEAMVKQAAECYRQKRFAEAKKLLQQLIAAGVSSADCYNQLGNTCSQLSQFVEAESYYRQALALQSDHLDVMYNLSLALRSQGRLEDAVAALLVIIKVAPNYIRAYFSLGQMLLEKQLPEEADRYFQHIVELDGDNQELLKSVVAALLEQGGYQQAKKYCEILIKLNPQLKEIQYNLGVIAEREQQQDEAIDYYHRVLMIDKDHFAATNNLAVIYLQQRNIEAAKCFFEQALALQPENKAIRYTLDAISGEHQYKEAPSEYIKQLFDHYADHYDKHLLNNLEYRVPQLLYTAIEQAAVPDEARWTILDLGCGTGLCGEVVKIWAKRLVGVDLAEKMLILAESKQIYHLLKAQHIIDYLKTSDEAFDLIIAGDVFIYFGDLTDVLLLCANRLPSKGYLAFSIELSKNGTYAMQESGRFTHSEEYIEQLAATHNFTVCYFKSVITRKQESDDLLGAIIVLQKE